MTSSYPFLSYDPDTVGEDRTDQKLQVQQFEEDFELQSGSFLYLVSSPSSPDVSNIKITFFTNRQETLFCRYWFFKEKK
jgi:hypothetical protein